MAESALPILCTKTPRTGLDEAKQGILWTYLSNQPRVGSLEVFAQPNFDVPRFGLSVLVEGTS